MLRSLFFVGLLAITSCAHQGSYFAKSSKAKRVPAQDSSSTDLAYVSSDGRYVGIFESLVQDGSGFNEVSFRILDMMKDKYLFNKTMVHGDEESEHVDYDAVEGMLRKDLLNLASSKIKSLGLKKKNMMPIENYMKDTPYHPMDLWASNFATEGSFQIEGKTYIFKVDALPAKASDFHKDSEYCHNVGFDTYKYQLTINGSVVHKDSHVPRSRGCPFSYGISKVYNINGKPLLFVRYSRLGFEGPDLRTITMPLWNH